MRFGLIGERLGHSYSPEIHSMIGRYPYELLELAPSELPAFLEKRDFCGVNVTVPYKQAVIPFLDRLSDTAAAIGAVNTVVNRDGLLWGFNTDLTGLLALIRSVTPDLSGKKVLILGTGGTSRTARFAASRLGAAEILSVSRSRKPGAITYEEACSSHADADFLINTTPCGMYPAIDDAPIDLPPFSCLQGVADVVYNPLSTRLVLEARERGIPARGGLSMLAAQAVEAAELFTGSPCPPDTAGRILRELTVLKRNPVLIGMPGSGKTAVGRCLASRLGSPFVDLDDSVVRLAGKPIPRIFAEDGEDAFRAVESAAVRELAGQTGLVAATGGGCVLRRENVLRLKMNGVLLLLDRPLRYLSPSADRPLADSAEKLSALSAARAPLYRAAADTVVPVSCTVEETAAAAKLAFYKAIEEMI